MSPMRLFALFALLASTTLGCEGEGTGRLFVDVRTDLRAGSEIVMVRVEVSPVDAPSMIQRADADVSSALPLDLATGIRVAEMSNVPLGEVLVSAQAIAPDGTVIVTRDVRFTLAATVGVTSGASVPEILVRDVLIRLAELGFDDVEDVDAVEEHMVFSLPPELRRDMKAAGIK